MQGSNATAGSKVPHSNAGVQRPAPDPSPEDYPVVEAMVRRREQTSSGGFKWMGN